MDARRTESVELARGTSPVVALPVLEKQSALAEKSAETLETHSLDESDSPTEEDLRTLERVSGKIPWTAYSIAFVELCERFSYYGVSYSDPAPACLVYPPSRARG